MLDILRLKYRLYTRTLYTRERTRSSVTDLDCSNAQRLPEEAVPIIRLAMQIQSDKRKRYLFDIYTKQERVICILASPRHTNVSLRTITHTHARTHAHMYTHTCTQRESLDIEFVYLLKPEQVFTRVMYKQIGSLLYLHNQDLYVHFTVSLHLDLHIQF